LELLLFFHHFFAPCEVLPSLGIRRPSVSFFKKELILAAMFARRMEPNEEAL
jgi:hypothetical protein